jgi:NAD(P)H-nitrite reductase large subunit
MKYVIIGNGFAGIRAIENIRENDTTGEIVLISDEENYSRPLISYYLGKKVKENALAFRSEKFFKENNVSLKIGDRASSIDTKNKQVIMPNGDKISYNKLLIATGGNPIVPPIDGVENEGVFSFVTIKDAKKIESYIKNNDVKNAIVLGGGLIGLKATEALMDLKIPVTVVELADRVLSATFDRKASRIIEKALQKANCDVITQDTITKILSENSKVSGVELKSNQKIEGQIAIIAIGVRPNIDIVKDTPIKTNRGIVVNEYLETSEKDIFAAGDVAECDGGVIAILPLAARQGRKAGINMSISDESQRIKYKGSIPMNSVTLADIPTISVGLTDPKENVDQYEIIEKYKPKANIYRKIILEDNVMVGAIFIGEIDRAGIFTGLIKDKMVVTPFKEELLKGTFGLISLPKNYRKHLVKGESIEI